MPVKLDTTGKCVIEPDGTIIKCHPTHEEALAHMQAVNANVVSTHVGKSIDNTVRNLLESKIHQSFTVAADEIFGRGYLDREDRIKLSGLIGKLLGDFGDSIDENVANTIVFSDDADWVNAKEVKSNIMFFKDADTGLWRWAGIVSNNRLDRHEEIITSEGHKNFVAAIDSGRYAREMGQEMPELWLWHVPFPIGVAKQVAYDARGFLVAAGEQLKGEIYDRIFESLSKIADTLGMSHSFPVMKTSFSATDSSHIVDYMSLEFTFLPLEKAANWLTGAAAVMFKELGIMQIPDNKRQWFVETLGEEVVNDIDRTLGDLEYAANVALKLPSKEHEKMSDLDGEVPEQGNELDAAKAEEGQEKVDEKAFPPEKKPKPDEEEEEDGEKKPKKEFITAEQFEKSMVDILKEVKEGVQTPFNALVEKLGEQDAQIKELTETVNKLKEADETRLAKQVATTPMASIAESLSKSIIGNSAAKVDYQKERDLYQGPEETKPETAGATGIKSIDDRIRRQQSGKRIYSGV
jgi:hypothetical protein